MRVVNNDLQLLYDLNIRGSSAEFVTSLNFFEVNNLVVESFNFLLQNLILTPISSFIVNPFCNCLPLSGLLSCFLSILSLPGTALTTFRGMLRADLDKYGDNSAPDFAKIKGSRVNDFSESTLYEAQYSYSDLDSTSGSSTINLHKSRFPGNFDINPSQSQDPENFNYNRAPRHPPTIPEAYARLALVVFRLSIEVIDYNGVFEWLDIMGRLGVLGLRGKIKVVDRNRNDFFDFFGIWRREG